MDYFAYNPLPLTDVFTGPRGRELREFVGNVRIAEERKRGLADPGLPPS
jgi:hypothetical protein